MLLQFPASVLSLPFESFYRINGQNILLKKSPKRIRGSVPLEMSIPSTHRKQHNQSNHPYGEHYGNMCPVGKHEADTRIEIKMNKIEK